MAFPTSTPSYAGFTSSHTLSQDSHAAQHNSEQADIIGLSNKVGTGASTPTSGLLLRGSGAGISAWAQVNLATDVTGNLPLDTNTNGILPISRGGTGGDFSAVSKGLVQAPGSNLPLVSTAQPYIPDFSNANHTHANTAGGGATLSPTTLNTNTINGTDHVAISAGSSKLVKSTVLRQDDTTNTYQVGNSVMLTGWGVITPGVTSTASETVTFGITFLQRPIVVLTPGGDAVSAATYGSGNNTLQGNLAGKATAITTTSFAAYIFAGGNWAAGNTVFYQWIAIGEI